MEHLKHIWPTISALASDLGRPYQTVASWCRRGIPAAQDGDIIAAAHRLGQNLTFEEMHNARKLEQGRCDRSKKTDREVA